MGADGANGAKRSVAVPGNGEPFPLGLDDLPLTGGKVRDGSRMLVAAEPVADKPLQVASLARM